MDCHRYHQGGEMGAKALGNDQHAHLYDWVSLTPNSFC